MDGEVIDEPPDTTYLDAELLENGLPKAVPAKILLDLPPSHLKIWCHFNAIYQFPTIELVEWLVDRIAGRKVLEICAGKSCLGRFIGARMCDNYQQTWPGVRERYELLQSPIITPQPGVDVMDAISVLYEYQPEVVVGAWVTQKFVAGDVDANMFGPDEALIIQKCDYIHIGNFGPHGTKRILKCEHDEFWYPWVISRAITPENNRIWVWPKQNYVYPKPTTPFLVGLPEAGTATCCWCPCRVHLTDEHLVIARRHDYPILCVGCATAMYGPDLVLSMLGR